MHTYVVDSGGTTRLLKKCYVVDSGGTTRALKKIWVVDSGGTSRLVFTSNIFVLTSGEEGTNVAFGYVQGSFGSLSPSNVLSDGNTIVEISTAGSGSGPPPHAMIVQFSIAKPQSYLVSIVVDGVTYLGSAASFSGGDWTWSNGAPLGGLGSQHTIQINIA